MLKGASVHNKQTLPREPVALPTLLHSLNNILFSSQDLPSMTVTDCIL